VNGPSAVTSVATQRLDIGAGYVLEINAQGSTLIAPSVPFVAAPLVAAPVVSASTTQRLDIGSGYVLETGPQGARIIEMGSLALAPASLDALNVDARSGYMLVKSIDRESASSSPQRIDIGGGSMLVYSIFGWNVVSNAPVKELARVSAALPTQKIDIGTGYMLVDNDAGSEMVPAP
jgi:hypothetical protein